MPKYTACDVRDALAAVINDQPDNHRDPRSTKADLACRYMNAGQPHCVVAHVMARLGINLRVIAQLDKEADRDSVRISDSRHPMLARFTPQARRLLSRMQREQDAGRPWNRLL